MKLFHTLAKLSLPFFLVLSSTALAFADEQKPSLTVYTYDSFASEWGLGPQIIKQFETANNVKVNLVAKGDGGQLLTNALLEQRAPKADLVLGLDNNQSQDVYKAKLFAPYTPKALASTDPKYRLDDKQGFIPFDYGFFAFIWDSEKLKNPPKSLEDLVSGKFPRQVILMDPRTSTPGLGFLAQMVAVYGDKWQAKWGQLKSNILNIAAGWDAGYGAFTQGEAPLVISYTTSPAYHLEYDKTERYKALDFPEGQILEIEGMGIVNGTKNLALAQKFIDYMLSSEVQAKLPLYQWMYPIVSGTRLPASFKIAPEPKKVLTADSQKLHKALTDWPNVAAK